VLYSIEMDMHIVRSRRLKRIIDIAGSTIGLVISFPIMVIEALLIFLTMGPPIIFRQERLGLNCKPFTMYKFRTMLDLRDENGNPLPDEKRLTRVGKFLRDWSLDELPQFWNVLKGDMSLVGPRPLPVSYLAKYDEFQIRRHEVKPGITGWVQVNGRNAIDWEEKFKLDVWYVDHWTIFLDIYIILLTILKVLKREGATTEGYATASDYEGKRISDL